MASLHPFRALRPAPPAAATVSSVPYDVVSVDEARQLAAGNPLSFLHVTRSEIDLPPGTDPYAANVYELARENLVALRAQAPLVVEDAPSVYFYRLRMGRTSKTASPAVSRSTSTSRTSSRSTSVRAGTRKTIARGTSSSCGRRRAWCS